MFVKDLQEGRSTACSCPRGRAASARRCSTCACARRSHRRAARRLTTSRPRDATSGAVSQRARVTACAELTLARCAPQPGRSTIACGPRARPLMEADLRELGTSRIRPAPAARRVRPARRRGRATARAGGQALSPGLPPRPARALAVGRAGRQRDQRDVRRHRPRRRRDGRAPARHRQARRLRASRATAIEMTDAGKLQGEIPLGYYRVRRLIDELDGFDPRHGRGRAAHHPQPPRQPRARQPGRAVHARGDARALLRQPRRAARVVRPAREGAAGGRALVALRPRDRLGRVLRRRARRRSASARRPD